jgi:2-dehydro-3-deoxygluconokinase
LAQYVDVMIGNEEDFSVALGLEVEGLDSDALQFETSSYRKMIHSAAAQFPFKMAAVTLRRAKTATRNDWSAICYYGDIFYEAPLREDLEIYDRVGGGDSFASGLIYGMLVEKGAQWAVECGAAHGALAMTTPGDTSMATLKEVLHVMNDKGARISR